MSKEFQFADLHVTLKRADKHLRAMQGALEDANLDPDEHYWEETFSIISEIDDLILLNDPQSPEGHSVYLEALNEYRKDDGVAHRLAEILIRTKVNNVATAEQQTANSEDT